MKKLILTGMAVAMLALPAASMASQPTNPGAFGKERSSNIAQYFTNDGYGNWGQFSDGAAARAGDNSLNTTWMQDHDQLPSESNAGL
jgi:hypothetical protein